MVPAVLQGTKAGRGRMGWHPEHKGLSLRWGLLGAWHVLVTQKCSDCTVFILPLGMYGGLRGPEFSQVLYSTFSVFLLLRFFSPRERGCGFYQILLKDCV